MGKQSRQAKQEERLNAKANIEARADWLYAGRPKPVHANSAAARQWGRAHWFPKPKNRNKRSADKT